MPLGSVSDRSIAEIVMSICVPVFLFLEARRLLAVEDDSSDDERPRNRRRLDNRAYCSAAAVTGQPPALAAFGSQYLVWLAACCAHTPAMGSGYWSRPRTKDFSLLVHSTWEDAMFYPTMVVKIGKNC